jgi:hypothetical protein
MKRYKVTLLVPHEKTIEAVDIQAAGREANRLTQFNNTAEGAPKALLHSVIEIKDDPVVDFGPSPAIVA